MIFGFNKLHFHQFHFIIILKDRPQNIKNHDGEVFNTWHDAIEIFFIVVKIRMVKLADYMLTHNIPHKFEIHHPSKILVDISFHSDEQLPVVTMNSGTNPKQVPVFFFRPFRIIKPVSSVKVLSPCDLYHYFKSKKNSGCKITTYFDLMFQKFRIIPPETQIPGCCTNPNS